MTVTAFSFAKGAFFKQSCYRGWEKHCFFLSIKHHDQYLSSNDKPVSKTKNDYLKIWTETFIINNNQKVAAKFYCQQLYPFKNKFAQKTTIFSKQKKSQFSIMIMNILIALKWPKISKKHLARKSHTSYSDLHWFSLKISLFNIRIKIQHQNLLNKVIKNKESLIVFLITIIFMLSKRAKHQRTSYNLIYVIYGVCVYTRLEVAEQQMLLFRNLKAHVKSHLTRWSV